MSAYQKGNLLAEGKTKKIWEVAGDMNLVIIENKTDITAFDDPKFTKQFGAKTLYATGTTCRVFELLKKAAVPVAYIEQISPTEFVAPKCSMIALEAVARRYAVGSYLKRNPNLEQPKGKPPIRFHRLVVEFFLKTTKGKLIGPGGKVIVDGLSPQKGEEDPLILNPYDEQWTLIHAKKPLWDSAAKIREGILASDVIENTLQMDSLNDYLRNTFLVLEGMWAILGYRFIDIKIEFGLTANGELLIADVIDNDSWRLTDFEWIDISKQAFRDGKAMGVVEKNYDIVSGLVDRFRIPQQCLVFWRGSDKDKFPEIPQDINLSSISVDEITASGHKSPRQSLNTMENLLSKYPDGGVIIVKVGMSNGLGPMLAARTSWPVVSIPAMLDKNPEDIWSNLRLPSAVPMAVICSEVNALNFALNILAQKNPFLYRQLQRKIEKLDE